VSTMNVEAKGARQDEPVGNGVLFITVDAFLTRIAFPTRRNSCLCTIAWFGVIEELTSRVHDVLLL
jgi:hypothetical protein